MSKPPSPKKPPDVVYAWEKLGQALADGLEDLIAFNAEESPLVGAPPLDVNWPKYLMLERLGSHRGMSARLGPKLIGYRSFFLENAMHYKGLKWAVNDALYVDPDHRKSRVGLTLIRRSDALLKAEGVDVVIQADRKLATAKPHATLGDLLRRLGYAPMEMVFAKRL
jgi:GNAT superfamily N-acetyltransferase